MKQMPIQSESPGNLPASPKPDPNRKRLNRSLSPKDAKTDE